jgi:hypothetical protein
MAINFSLPVTSEDRATVLADIRAHVTALAKMFDGETLSNTPTGAVRYSSSNDQFEIWDGATWGELPLLFLKRSGGTLTGGLTGTTAAFSGAITQGGRQVWHAGNFDPTTKLGVSATAARASGVVTADPSIGQGGAYVTATDFIFRDGSANRTVWHNNNFNPATKQDAATAWNTGNFDPNSKQNALGFTPVNKAGDTMSGGLTAPSLTSSGAVTTSEWFRTNGAQGWYSNTYGIGIYATDASYVRTYGGAHMMAAGYQISSKRSLKKKIKPVKRGALGRVLDWKIYDYELKKTPGKPQIGLMADEADRRIGDDEGVNTNAALFELAAAFQEYVRKHP